MNRMNPNTCRANIAVLALALWTGIVGCQSTHPITQPVTSVAQPHAVGAPPQTAAATPAANPESLVLQEGDTIHISFPGAPALNTVQTIRRDGKITLDLVGEINAAGLKPHALEVELIKKLGDQLVEKEVSVTVQSSTFIVYVTGCVLRPGKLISERVLSPLQAVIEAGIDHNKASLKKVTVVRDLPNGQRLIFKLNLDKELKGEPTEPFDLKPFDTIFVPEKFTWY